MLPQCEESLVPVPVPVPEPTQTPVPLPHIESVRTVKIALAFLFVFAYFLLLSFDGLRAYFTSDDGMNVIMMHGYFTTPLWRLVLDALQVCTSSYRPLGGLFYRAIYAGFHFDPLPFRVACYCVLTVNLLLAGWLMRCLSGLWEVAAIGALLFSFHGALIGLFYNTGTIYDLLCATFYVLAFLQYIYFRNNRVKLSVPQTAAVVLTYACALDSKEMAASLPLTLIAYELVYFGVPQTWSRSVWDRFRMTALLSLLTLAFTVIKTALPSPMTVNPLYRPSMSPHLLLHNLSWYYNLLLYRTDLLTTHTILFVVAAMFLLAWWMRSRAMLFGLLFALLTLLPVLIIAPRGGLVMYLPLIGWATWAAVPLVQLRYAATRLFGRYSASAALTAMTQAVLLLCLAILLYPIHQRKRNDLRFTMRQEQSEMRDILEQMKKQVPAFPHNSHILFTDDPFRPDDWGLFFLVQLQYNDPTLVVERRKTMPESASQSQRNFRYVFAFRDGVLTQLPPELPQT